jgi:plasmid maintenance system antidote protein VapI
MTKLEGTTVSEQLRRAAVDCDESIKELARATDIGVCQLYHFIAGRRGLSQKAIDRLASHLGVTLRKTR